MQTLKNTNILVIVLDLIEDQFFHFQVRDLVKMLIFGADMSSSIHIDNKKKEILVLGRGPTQGLESTLNAEKMYSINFIVTKKKFCLSLHYNGTNSYLFVNSTEIIKFKAKDSEIVASPLFVGNISKDWSTDNMKKNRAYWLSL